MNEESLVARARELMVRDVDLESVERFIEDVGGENAFLRFVREYGEEFSPLLESYDERDRIRRGYN